MKSNAIAAPCAKTVVTSARRDNGGAARIVNKLGNLLSRATFSETDRSVAAGELRQASGPWSFTKDCQLVRAPNLLTIHQKNVTKTIKPVHTTATPDKGPSVVWPCPSGIALRPNHACRELQAWQRRTWPPSAHNNRSPAPRLWDGQMRSDPHRGQRLALSGAVLSVAFMAAPGSDSEFPDCLGCE
jgi:hypothetical protein